MALRSRSTANEMRRRRRGLLAPALLVVLAGGGGAEVLALSASASADEDQDDNAVRHEPMSLDCTDLAFEAESDFDARRVKTRPPGLFSYKTNQTNRTLSLRELVRVGLEGATADPDLFSFGGSLGLGLDQERYNETYDGSESKDGASGTLAEYDLSADVFRAKKISGNVFGLSTHDRYARPFLPSLRERRTDFGTTWTFNDDRFPMELRAEHRDTDRDGSRRDLDTERISEDLFQYSVTWNHRPSHTAKFDIQYNNREERYGGTPSGYLYGGDNSFNTQWTQLRLDDNWQFGPDNGHHLDSTVRYQEEKGDLRRNLLELGPRLTLTHSPQLSSYYQYQYSREQVGQLDVDLHRGDVGFVHQLFTNLTTTANLFGLNEDIEQDSVTREFGGSIDWSYTRNNSLGTFSADLGLTHEYERAHGGGTRVQMRESATFRDPLPVVLYRPRVLLPSIIVWNSARTRVYIAGIDYLVYWFRDRMYLSRSLLGSIADNQSVSIDYIYFEDRDATRSATRVDFRVQEQFESGWTPYYALETRHEDRDISTGMPLRANDLNRHRMGVKYQKQQGAYGSELEILHDQIDPFVAYRIFAQQSLLSRPSASIDGRLDFSQFFFDHRDRISFFEFGPMEDVWLAEGSLDGRYQISRDSNAFARLRYRYQDDNARGITHGIDAEVGSEIHWGLYSVSATIEYDLLNIVDSRENGLGVWLRLRRDLTDLLKRQ